MLRLSKFLSELSRRVKVLIQLALDFILVTLSFIAAMNFRLDSFDFLFWPKTWPVVLLAVVASLFAFGFFGLYSTLVRFITGNILLIVWKGALVGAVTLYLSSALIQAFMPRSVPIIFAVFVLLSVGGARFLARRLFRSPNHSFKRNVIIYGAGESGRQLLNSLIHEGNFVPVALVDDSSELQNLGVGGLRVYPPSHLQEIIHQTGAQLVLLAIPSLTRARRHEIVRYLEQFKIEIKTIPGLAEIISGQAKISELRAISTEDLLGRDPVAPVLELLSRNIKGRVVMVTGAGGSIGSELCRQILDQYPSALVLYEVSEFALYTIHNELSEQLERAKLNINLVPILGSIQSPSRVEEAISANGVQTIYHAAAYKHVPLVEDNVVEAIKNNVFGTLNVVKAAQNNAVQTFIMISTDKAVRPTNVMGATKRIAELICQGLAKEKGQTCIAMVRFGNVLGSSGSVIPRFKQQIETGGPVTVTHHDITRFFMTIPEASQLVIQAGAMATGGDVFVLDMGDPVKILDVAMGMVRLHGLTPYLVDDPSQVFPEKGDIPICITGLRKGEKLFEELLIGNNPQPTRHPKILTASEVSLSFSELVPFLDDLSAACKSSDLTTIYKILHALPIEYKLSDVSEHARS